VTPFEQRRRVKALPTIDPSFRYVWLICKIYAESFRGRDHLRRILDAAQTIVNDALATVKPPGNGLREEHERTEKRA